MENSRKILIFSTAYYPFVGGAEVAIKEITDRIPGIQFDLITARLQRNLPRFEERREGVSNVNIYRVGVGIPILDKLLLPFWGAKKARKLNDKNHYQAYWCMMVSFASGAAYIANIFSKIKVPIVLTLQEGDSEGHLKYKWLGLIHLSWWLALKGASAVTAISSYLAGRAERLGYKGEVNIIPNGGDLNNFGDIHNWKKSDMPFNYVYLITTSRLSKKNGLEHLIKSISYLSKEPPIKFKLIIFGEGPLKEKLISLAKSIDPEKERIFFEGYKSHNEIVEEIRKFENINVIFIRPSLSEGMGNSFIEAMAAGMPVIGTPVGGIVDFLKDGETGLLCNVNDPKSIAGKVMEYVNNPDLTSKIVENAKKLVEGKYDWNLIVKQMEKVFDGINSNKTK